MAIAILAQRNALATQYGTAAPYGVLFSADPGTTGSVTGELTSPTTRQALSWGSVSASVITSAATNFSVGSGVTVTYFGVAVSSTAGTSDLRDKVAVTSQTFSSAGTYVVTASYTQS